MRAKIRAIVLVILAAGAMLAQQPIQVQGRDYAKGTPHTLNTDSTGKLNVNATVSGGSGCAGTVGTPCVVAGPAANGVAVSGAPVRIGGKDQNSVTRDLALTDGGLLPVNSFALAGADGVSNTVQSPANQVNSQIYTRVLPYIFNGSTNDRQFNCSNSAPIAVSGSGNTELVSLTASTRIRICHISWSVSDGSALAVKLTTGTGTNCGTGTADLTGVYTSPAVALDFGPAAALRGPASNAICANLGSAVAVGGTVVYAKF